MTALLDGFGPLGPLDAGLSAATGVLAPVVAGWAVLVLVVAVAARITVSRDGGTGPVLERALGLLAPGLAGRVLRAAVGIGAAGSGLLAAGLAAPAASSAAVTVATTTGSPAPAPVAALSPTTVTTDPARAVPRPPGRGGGDLWPLSTPTRTVTGHSETVVRRGDTLWAIAARHLPPQASDSRIDALWRHWYAHNQAVIGPDPNLLLPGQVLRAPF